MLDSFYTKDDLKMLGLCSFGENVFISKKASIYNPDQIIIGSNVRINDFCILSGKIKIGDFVSIGAFTSICSGLEGILIEDFVSISRNVSIFAKSDDFSGKVMTNPLIPIGYKNVCDKHMIIKKHVVVGSTSVILPLDHLGEGSVIGAMSLMKNSSEPWKIYSGIPGKIIKDRKKDLLKLEKNFIKNNYQ